MRFLLLAVCFLLSATPLLACEQVSVRWNGDYPQNNEKVWSKDYDLGWSKNFLNGTPQEQGRVQREGTLMGTICLPKSPSKVPFIVLMHGCAGLDTNTKKWAREYTERFNDEGYGVLVLDSFTTRSVHDSCGKPDGHWARRRAEDAYSALEFLGKSGYADVNKVYLIGRSNGGNATIMAMETKTVAHHPFKFKAGFALVPGCGDKERETFYAPLIVLVAGQDDANNPSKCVALGNYKRADDHPLVKVIVYRDALHGFMEEVPNHRFHGWRMGYDEFAANNSLDVVREVIKGTLKGHMSGVEYRP
jgi:dienelactone hydrolase